mgnify:CR=1 FL=1
MYDKYFFPNSKYENEITDHQLGSWIIDQYTDFVKLKDDAKFMERLLFISFNSRFNKKRDLEKKPKFYLNYSKEMDHHLEGKLKYFENDMFKEMYFFMKKNYEMNPERID